MTNRDRAVDSSARIAGIFHLDPVSVMCATAAKSIQPRSCHLPKGADMLGLELRIVVSGVEAFAGAFGSVNLSPLQFGA